MDNDNFESFDDTSEYCAMCHAPFFTIERSAPHSDICQFCEEELNPDDYSTYFGDDWDGSTDDFDNAF